MKNEIEKRLGAGFNVIELTVPKNNGITKHGFAIQKAGENIGCTIYIDDIPEDKAVDYVINEFHRWSDEVAEEAKNAKRVMEPEYVLDNVFPILLNYTLNKDRLDKVVHRSYLDLAIAYRVQISEGATALITTQLLEHLEITEEALYERAVKNIDDHVEIFKADDDTPMLILSRRDKTWGSGAILSKNTLDLLNSVYEGDNFFLIPSSVDEWVVLPCQDDDMEKVMKPMLSEMASRMKNKVAPEDFLTSSIYICRNGKVEIA